MDSDEGYGIFVISMLAIIVVVVIGGLASKSLLRFMPSLNEHSYTVTQQDIYFDSEGKVVDSKTVIKGRYVTDNLTRDGNKVILNGYWQEAALHWPYNDNQLTLEADSVTIKDNRTTLKSSLEVSLNK